MTLARSLPISRGFGRLIAGLALSFASATFSFAAPAAPKISSPKELIGFTIGDDYHVANYSQITQMWQTWAAESDRMELVKIGPTGEGRNQYMAIISSPANLAKLDHYRDIAARLALARDLTDDEAQSLAKEGKAVLWIDGGLHSSESVGSQQLAETVYQYLCRDDEEARRFLDDVILLAPLANPDGIELVANWYMRQEDPKKRSFVGLPRLYNKYIGHDNNRDFIMTATVETVNLARVMFREWYPQIVYNHHQVGPAGSVVFIPPFRDPFNFNYDALIPIGIDRVAMAMHERLISRGMGGSAMRTAANYSTWWNGGLRTTAYFHNQIGILTEVIGSPTPMVLPLIPSKQLPQGDWPLPVQPQLWHYRQSIDYEVQLNWAALDYASRNRELLLANIYRMGKNSIDRGNRDTWTITPKRIEALNEAAGIEPPKPGQDELAGLFAKPAPSELYESVLHDPAHRDPRGFILPSDQADFPTAVKFINALMRNGVAVERATTSFEVAGKAYPAGSYVVKTAQAFRPFVMDMFEPQDHPNDFAYPGGPPKMPYDITGWTLAVQMGVKFDRILDGFDGPFVAVTSDQEPAPVAPVVGPSAPAGYLVSHKINDAFVLTNRLLKAGCDVYWLKDEHVVDGVGLGTGTLWIPASATATPIVETAARELGVGAYAQAKAPSGAAMKLKPIRIGLLDLYGGMVQTGWLRLMFDEYEFPYEVVYPKLLEAGGLNQEFDVLVFPGDTYLVTGRSGGFPKEAMVKFLDATAGTAIIGTGMFHYDPPDEQVPEEMRSLRGSVGGKTIPALKTFVAAGGTIVGIGSSSTVGEAMGMPITDFLTEPDADGKPQHLPKTKFFVPGSILAASFDNKNPLAYGMPEEGYIFFDNNPVFGIDPNPALMKTNRVAWFTKEKPLFSGWAWGQEHLQGGELATEASLGKGKVALIGLEATFRSMPHATFKLFFNSLYYGSATETTLP